MTEGLLEVELVLGKRGRTQVARLLQRFPQRITVPMYLDDNPGRACLCVQNPTGGVFPGDRLNTRVLAGPGASVYVTAQSATQVFAAHQGSVGEHAGSDSTFVVAGGAVVEHFPKTVIPHAGSTYRQSMTVALEGDGVFIGWEALAAGRIGHGERLAYQEYDARTVVWRDGAVVARERLLLRPAEADLAGPAVLNGHDYLGTLLVLVPGQMVGRLLAALRGRAATSLTTSTAEDVVCGVSALPGEVGVLARVLARRAPALAAARDALWATAKAALADGPSSQSTAPARQPTIRM